MTGRSTTRLALILALLVLAAAAPAPAQDDTAKTKSNAPEPGTMMTYYLCLLSRTGEADAVQQQHWGMLLQEKRTWLQTLADKGSLLLSGPVSGHGGDGDTLKEVFVITADSLPVAKAIAAGHPGVRSGYYRLAVHPWWAMKGIMKTPPSLDSTETYHLGLLCKGDAWTPGTSPELKKLQEEHLGHLNKLWKEGLLVIAGPLGSGEFIRGIGVYKTTSKETAQQAADADPAAKAGRLKMHIYRWELAKGALP